MKVLHLPNASLPWSTGGTETYVLGLAKALKAIEVESIFCIHQKNKDLMDLGNYMYEDFPIRVLAPIPGEGNRKSVYTREYPLMPDFEEYLEETTPDLVHFHDLSGGSSLSHLRMVKRQNIPSLMTYHSPGQSCLQRALRYGNQKICDGKLDLKRCIHCQYKSKGLPKVLGILSPLFGKSLEIQDGDSKIKRILTVPTATKLFIDSFKEMVLSIDKIHTHAHWVEDLFLRNGVPKSKLFFARTAYPNLQEIPVPSFDPPFRNMLLGLSSLKTTFTQDNPLKLVFLGRCDFVKGVQILIEAALLLPKEAPIEFHFFGPYWDTAFGKKWLEKMKGDVRFKAPRLLSPRKVMTELVQMDLMVVPSIWPETGPLSLLEGLSAGLPILGSQIGGISEWVVEGENGYLFPYGDASALKEKICLILDQPQLLIGLKRKAMLKRTMYDLAQELKGVYSDLVSSKMSVSSY